MNELVLKEYNVDHLTYYYRPDGKGDYGEIAYSFADKTAKLAKQAKNDEIGRYGHKAISKVEECVKENNLPMRFIQAWY